MPVISWHWRCAAVPHFPLPHLPLHGSCTPCGRSLRLSHAAPSCVVASLRACVAALAHDEEAAAEARLFSKTKNEKTEENKTAAPFDLASVLRVPRLCAIDTRGALPADGATTLLRLLTELPRPLIALRIRRIDSAAARALLVRHASALTSLRIEELSLDGDAFDGDDSSARLSSFLSQPPQPTELGLETPVVLEQFRPDALMAAPMLIRQLHLGPLPPKQWRPVDL
jgi:hypothetical protein